MKGEQVDQDRSSTGFMRTLAAAEAAADRDRWQAAIPLWEQVIAANPVEGRYWNALAKARYQADEFAAALPAYERALALRDWYPAETAFHIACCHARLGDEDQALSWLDRALTMGYRDLERARTDRAFAGLREHPRYRELAALIDTDGMSRDEGWRTDLQFLAREIKRRAYAPFGQVTEAEFDRRVAEISERIPGLTDHQVLVEMALLMRVLGDGHALIMPPDDDEAARHSLPIHFALFPEGLFVVAAAPEHTDLLGAQVLEWDGQPTETVIAALDRIVQRDNDQWPGYVMSWRLRELPTLHALGVVDDPRQVTLSIRDAAGETRSVPLTTDTSRPATKRENQFPYPAGWAYYPATLPGPMPLYLRNLTIPFWFTYLRHEQTVYFQFNAVRDAAGETLAAFVRRLFAFIADQPVEKLVIDMRWNNGGNTLLEIELIQRLISSKVNHRGRLFVIIGRATFSAAQNGCGMFSRYTPAIFVGEPTGSSPTFIGESVHFTLPYSQAQANVSDLLWQSTWPMDYRPWIAPTLYAPPTFADFRANRDPALDAILNLDADLPGR